MIFIADNKQTETVEVNIPTVRKAVAPISISIVNETTKDSYTISANIVSSSNISMKVKVEILSTYPKGQYSYTATDTNGSISIGVLQIGSTDTTPTEYQQVKTTKVYEG